MTDKASPAGWVVRVTSKRPDGSTHVQVFEAAIPDAFDALEAVRKVSGCGNDATIEAITELAARTLPDGQVFAR